MRSSMLVTLASDMRIQTTRLALPLKTNAGFPDLGLRAALFGGEEPFDEALPPPDPEGEKQHVWMIRDSFRCHYLMGSDPNREQLWLLGPYLTEDMSLTEINRRYDKIGLRNVDMQFLSQYYNAIPRIRDENLLYTIIHSHCSGTYGVDGFEIAYWEMTFSHQPKAVKSEPVKSEYQRDMIEYVYAQEKLLMDCIARGNHSGAVSAIHKLERKRVDSRTTSTMRDMKNFSIVFNTLCRIAARQGGVSACDIDQYSRSASIQLENAASLRELQNLRETMLREYCDMVRATRQQGCSPMIQQVMDMMEARFTGHLSLQEAAAAVNLSPNYLSMRFRQETGKTFSDYLTEIRINRARQMLLDTDLQVSAIAAECGIPDNNYFSRLFRHLEGMTPREFRMKHKKQ